MAKPTLSIIYVNYQSADLLIDSLKSLFKYTKELNFEVIVVDNSKEEKLKNELKSLPSITYIESKNNGFGSACNLGSEKAIGDFLLFLNPDTKLVDNSISKMVDYLKSHYEIGALSPLVYNPDGKMQKHFYANNMSLWSLTLGRLTEPSDIRIAQLLHGSIARKNNKTMKQCDNLALPVGMVSGAAMMIRRELFRSLKGFDENFFMYLEDDDLCFRLNKLGYRVGVFTKAKVIHLEGRSSVNSDKKVWYYKSQDYYFKKHYGLFAMLIMKLIRLPYRLLKPRV
jgi:GT2 family glycosyltransferase